MKHKPGLFTATDLYTGNIVKEIESFKCGHCQYVGKIHKDEQKSETGGWCQSCATLLCKKPRCWTGCIRWETKLGLI
jgi:hypothetical protein